jgi:uncharacterized membrane protein YvbJ
MIKLTPLLEVKIANPNSPEKRFESFILDWLKLNKTKISPLLKIAYANKRFDDNLINNIINYYQEIYDKYDLEFTDGFKDWIRDIKGESLSINSSGSYYSALQDIDGLHYTGKDMGIEDEDKIYDIMDRILYKDG